MADKDGTAAAKSKRKPNVTSFPEGWHLIEAGSWQVSVGPDGLLMLPRHLHPSEVEDFCRAATAAAEVGMEVVKANEKKTSPVPAIEALEASIFVRHTAEPAAGMRMQVQPRTGTHHQAVSSIGRPKARAAQQDTPATPTPPKMPGARRGRSS